MSWQEIRDFTSRAIGLVLRYDAARYSSPRLIQVSSRTPNLASQDVRAQLIFDFWEGLPAGTEPFVPGFVLVSHDSQTGCWGFMPAVEGDPYAQANVLIPREGAEKLADTYEEIGLAVLAHRLRTHKTTVAELVECIIRHTSYAIPDKPPPPLYFSEIISNFKRYVRDDELWLQCTGSGVFLKNSLEMVFGKGCAAIQRGYVLPTYDSVINAAEHVQVSFVHGGQTYLLDATGRGGAGSFFGRPKLQNHRQAPLLSLPGSKPSGALPAKSEETVDIGDEQLRHNKRTFEQQLMNIYGCSNAQQLYRRLVAMPKNDPIRRAVAAMMQSGAPAHSMQTSLRYIELIMMADNNLLKKLGLFSYKDHPILRIAQEALRDAIGVRMERRSIATTRVGCKILRRRWMFL